MHGKLMTFVLFIKKGFYVKDFFMKPRFSLHLAIKELFFHASLPFLGITTEFDLKIRVLLDCYLSLVSSDGGRTF